MGSATNLLDGPWAKLRQMVVAPGGVLCLYLATRPAVEEHVIGSVDQPLSRPWAKLRQIVVAPGGVLCLYLATRPAVGEHVIGSATQPSQMKNARSVSFDGAGVFCLLSNRRAR